MLSHTVRIAGSSNAVLPLIQLQKRLLYVFAHPNMGVGWFKLWCPRRNAPRCTDRLGSTTVWPKRGMGTIWIHEANQAECSCCVRGSLIHIIHANIPILAQQFHLAVAKYLVCQFSGFPSANLTPCIPHCTLLTANKSLPNGNLYNRTPPMSKSEFNCAPMSISPGCKLVKCTVHLCAPRNDFKATTRGTNKCKWQQKPIGSLSEKWR